MYPFVHGPCRSVFAELHVIQTRILAFAREKLLMRPRLNDLAAIEYDNAVRFFDGRQSMSNYERRPVLHQLIQGFLNAGLIHEIIITRIPILIGSGIPLFGPVNEDLKLQHIETRSFANGFVQSKYRALE